MPGKLEDRLSEISGHLWTICQSLERLQLSSEETTHFFDVRLSAMDLKLDALSETLARFESMVPANQDSVPELKAKVAQPDAETFDIATVLGSDDGAGLLVSSQSVVMHSPATTTTNLPLSCELG